MTETDELAVQLERLVAVALNQGVSIAVEQAEKIGNPALVDALHDALIEEIGRRLKK